MHVLLLSASLISIRSNIFFTTNTIQEKLMKTIFQYIHGEESTQPHICFSFWPFSKERYDDDVDKCGCLLNV